MDKRNAEVLPDGAINDLNLSKLRIRIALQAGGRGLSKYEIKKV